MQGQLYRAIFEEGAAVARGPSTEGLSESGSSDAVILKQVNHRSLQGWFLA